MDAKADLGHRHFIAREGKKQTSPLQRAIGRQCVDRVDGAGGHPCGGQPFKPIVTRPRSQYGLDPFNDLLAVLAAQEGKKEGSVPESAVPLSHYKAKFDKK